MSDLKRGSEHTLTLTSYDADGLAVGELDGVEVHVDGGVASERVRVAVEHVSPHQPRAWARLLSVETPSDQRVRRPDDDGHRCGGCSWSHLSIDAQRQAKEARLREVVDACQPPAQEPEPLIVPSPQPSGYRNRGKYVLARKHGKVVLGGYRPRSHVVASTLGCPVMAPAVDEAARILGRALGHRRWSIYDEQQGRGLLRHAAIRENDRHELLITLVVTRPAEDRPWKKLAQSLRRQLPGLRGLTLDVNPEPGNVLFSGETVRIWGSSELVDRYGDAVVRLTGQGFGQVNREVATALYAHAAGAALQPLPGKEGPPSRVWDLFSGAGALTQTLARRAEASEGRTPDVLGVERDEAAVALAAGAAQSAGLDSCRYRAGDANEMLRGSEGVLPEVVVCNPPRTGCRPPLLEALLEQRIGRVVYVSCSPETLSRDLSRLVDGGLRLQSLQGYDMLPQTPHLELLAVLER